MKLIVGSVVGSGVAHEGGVTEIAELILDLDVLSVAEAGERVFLIILVQHFVFMPITVGRVVVRLVLDLVAINSLMGL